MTYWAKGNLGLHHRNEEGTKEAYHPVVVCAATTRLLSSDLLGNSNSRIPPTLIPQSPVFCHSRRLPNPLLRLSWKSISTMAANKAHGHADMQCPDPSAHEKQNTLSAAASTAALYVTNPQNKNERAATPKEDVLDSDGKLSSKGRRMDTHVLSSQSY